MEVDDDEEAHPTRPRCQAFERICSRGRQVELPGDRDRTGSARAEPSQRVSPTREEGIVKPDRTIRKRERLARDVERACVPERPFPCSGPRYLVHPSVAGACAPPLRAIAAALREETCAVDDAGLAAVAWFVKDGSSPFFGWDSKAALGTAIRLQEVVTGPGAGSPRSGVRRNGRRLAGMHRRNRAPALRLFWSSGSFIH